MRVALVGAGKIASEEHLPAWAAVEGASLTWVVDRDAGRAQAAAQQWGIPAWTTDLSHAVAAGTVDAVDLCTSAFTHVELVQAALRLGLHVLVEKPLAESADAAQALCDEARAARRVLMVAENWPYSSAFRRVQEIVASGQLGTLHGASVVHRSGLRRGAPRPDHGVLGHTFIAGSHAIHLLRLLMGPVSQVMGYWHGRPERGAGGMVLDAAAEILFSFDSGAIGSMHISALGWEPGPRQLFLRLEGSRGQVEFDVLAGWVRSATEAGCQTEAPRATSLGYREELEAFRSAVAASGTAPHTDDAYVDTLRTVEAIYRSFRGGKPEVPARAGPG